MQTLNFKIKAGALKGIVDLPNFDDEQLVNISVSPETEKKSLTEDEVLEIINELADSLANSPDKNKSLEQIRYERIMQKHNACKRAEKNSIIMDEIQKLIGDDKVWNNEEEMIQYLSEMRRQNNLYENHA